MNYLSNHRRPLFIALLCLTACLCAVATGARRAQGRSSGKASAGAPARQILALRRDLAEAIKARNRTLLERLYADDFTHTHASGKVDDKGRRIAALVSGEPTIESAEVDDISVRTYGAATAVATGQSTIRSRGENASATRYRWTVVYVRRAGRWQIVASQATRVE